MRDEVKKVLKAIRPSRLVPIFRFFAPQLKPHSRTLAAALALSFLSVCFLVAQPWPLKLVFDYILYHKRKHAELLPFYDWLSQDKAEGMLVICALVLLIAIGRAVTEYFQVLLATHVGQKIVLDLRARLFDHLQTLSIGFHTRARSGDLLMRLTGDINLLRELFVGITITLLSNLMIIVLVVTMMFLLDVQLTLLALSVLPVLAFISLSFGMRIREAVHRQRRKESEVAVAAHEALIGIRAIQAFNRERASRKLFEKQNRTSFREGMRAARLEVIAAQWTEVVLAVGTVLVLWFGVQAARGSSPRGTPGDLIVFFFYLRTIYRPVREFSKLAARAAKAGASAERVMEILRQQPEITDLPEAVPAPRLQGHIVFEHVKFGYTKHDEILKGIDLEIRPGEKIALVGLSGGGKTTLTSLLPRFHDPARGRVLIDGRDVREFTLKSLRRQISVVMQESLLFGATVHENLAFGRPDATREQVERAARRAHAHEFIMNLPKGYDTVLAERGLSLSEGQKQRLSLARAFLKRAPILVLDEPTSNVDVQSEKAIIRSIQHLISDTTTILITHNIKMIHFVDRIVVLDQGRIAECGTHHELLAAGGIYAHMVGIQTAMATASGAALDGGREP